MLPDEFNNSFHDLVLQILWESWSLLGVSSSLSSEQNHLILDPEALLFASFHFARKDPRLFDEIVDWLLINGDMIHVQRLKSIMEKEKGEKTYLVFLAISKLLHGHKRNFQHWRLISKSDFESLEVLFQTYDGLSLPTPRQPDALFKSFGFLREEIKPRFLSRPFPERGISSYILRLRALTGISSRCELICQMMVRESVTVKEAASFSAYSNRTIQQSFSNMARSGFLHQFQSGREIRYSLNEHVFAKLPRSSQLDSLRIFPETYEIFHLLISLSRQFNKFRVSKTTEDAQIAMIRNFLKTTSRKFPNHLTIFPFPQTLTASREEFFTILLEEFRQLFREFNLS